MVAVRPEVLEGTVLMVWSDFIRRRTPATGASYVSLTRRTEFRPMEVQPTDAENAAFVVFVVLVTRVILAFDLNLYIPLSKVDENMRRAHMRDGVHEQKVTRPGFVL